jgi:hypothetical protein
VVHWRLVPSAAADRGALSHGLLARSRELFGPDADLAIDFVAAIPRTAEGKLLRVVTSAGRSSPAPGGATPA